MIMNLLVELVTIPSVQEVKTKQIIDAEPQRLQTECIC